MFLTRMGFGSKMVITGDVTQIDLPEGRMSGLVEVQEILKGVPGIAFVYLSDRDVIRHELVQRIIKAYERYESQTAAAKAAPGSVGPRKEGGGGENGAPPLEWSGEGAAVEVTKG